jgi:hypothetical protein
LRLDPQEQAIAVLDAIRDCMNPESNMAHLPDVVRICELSGIERTLAYKIIDRWNNQCWRKIGSSIGYIS